MSEPQVAQESLFQDPLGMQLRAARERRQLSVEQAAQQLRLPHAVVEAMEREDWERLGARIYVRSYLGSYLRLLGLPQALLEQVADAKPPAPPLVTLATRSRMRHTLDTSLRQLVYLVMTVALVGSVVLIAQRFQTHGGVQELTLDGNVAGTVVADAAPATAQPSTVESASLPEAAPVNPDVEAAASLAGVEPPVSAPSPATMPAAAPAPADPVLASMAPFQSAAAGQALVLRFHQESWVEVLDPHGIRLERGLVKSGDERHFAAGAVGRITIGNADGVDVQFGGKSVDLAPFRAANVARFAVSSDGQPAAAAN